MSIKTTAEIMAKPIGFEIGASDDHTQAALLNGFFKGFYNSMKDNHRRELQMCYVADKLSDKSKELILVLAEFVKTSDEKLP